jgi:hypothetical protein
MMEHLKLDFLARRGEASTYMWASMNLVVSCRTIASAV